MGLGTIASAIGKEVFAGAAGTMAMTAASTIEMKARGREQSTARESRGGGLRRRAGERAGGAAAQQARPFRIRDRLGVPRGVMRAIGLKAPLAAGLHFAAVWGAVLAMLAGLKVAPPPKEWGRRELAIDALHHAVYAAATGAAYEWLDRSDRKS